MANVVKDWQCKRSSFSGPGLGTSKDVFAIDGWRNSLGLNGGRSRVLFFGKCFFQWCKQVERFKGVQRSIFRKLSVPKFQNRNL